MPILDKNLLLSEIEERLNYYVPANTVRQIINDAAEAMTRYEVTRLKPSGDDDESDQLIELFLNAKEIEGRSGKTIDRYRYILKRLHESSNIPFTRITVYHIRQYMMQEKERGISLSTIKSNAWVYNSCFGWLFNEGLIQTNPTSNLGQIKVMREEELPFSGEQIQLLKEAAENDCESAIIHFLLSTGCRISEACSVNRDDVDFANLQLQVLGKGNKIRMVYIDNVTAMMLKRYLNGRNDFYGMPYLTVQNSLKDHQQFWTYWCPKCGVGGKFLEFGSQYLALKDWNELQTSLRTDPWKYVEVIDDGESGS